MALQSNVVHVVRTDSTLEQFVTALTTVTPAQINDWRLLPYTINAALYIPTSPLASPLRCEVNFTSPLASKVQYLLAQGAIPDASAMVQAATGGFNAVINLLVAAKGDVNGMYNNETPLMAAVFHGQTSTVSLLLELEADTTISNEYGHTAAQLH